MLLSCLCCNHDGARNYWPYEKSYKDILEEFQWLSLCLRNGRRYWIISNLCLPDWSWHCICEMTAGNCKKQLQGDKKIWQPILNSRWTNEQQIGYYSKSNQWNEKKKDLGNFSQNSEGHKDKNNEKKEIWKTKLNDPNTDNNISKRRKESKLRLTSIKYFSYQ